MSRSLLIALVVLPLGLVLNGCETLSKAIAVTPKPGEALLLPCQDPSLATIDATDNEIATERVRVMQAYLDCRQRQRGLVEWVRDVLMK